MVLSAVGIFQSRVVGGAETAAFEHLVHGVGGGYCGGVGASDEK